MWPLMYRIDADAIGRDCGMVSFSPCYKRLSRKIFRAHGLQYMSELTYAQERGFRPTCPLFRRMSSASYPSPAMTY
jgi:hypothetical protein